MDVDYRDKLIQIVKERGPVLPNDVHRELKTNTLFASAMLSELVDSKILCLSNLKIGGSPLYYVSGQEVSLQNWANKMHEKEQKAFHLLRDQKVLRDIDQDPVIRACLRQIKDFAIPLEVNYDAEVELFWKWYLISNEEAEPLIKQQLQLSSPSASPQACAVEDASTATGGQPAAQGELHPASSAAHMQSLMPVTSELSNETGIGVVNSVESVSFHLEFGEKTEQTSTGRADKRATRKAEIQESLMHSLDNKPLAPPVPPKNDAFFDEVAAFFAGNDIGVVYFEVLRKNSEIDFLITLPSRVGLLNYYCRAKNKQKISDGDLSSAYVQGQVKKLPVLFLTTGELSKKAADLASREFKSMFIKHMEFEKKKSASNNSDNAPAA
ncbi:hypothetical protein HY772_01010 [Candidatus Woesearchaeota archaeon]|nr:hypothetical protein [Candidatus Woesearchaeota archaeon]